MSKKKKPYLGTTGVLWALNDAPDVPAHLVAALVAVAAKAGDDGCGAYPSVTTIAAMIRKNERNTKKDLAELVHLKLLKAGDQGLVKNIRADKRPKVYNLAMPRGVAEDTPSSMTRGVAEGTSGVSQETPKELPKGSSRKRARGNGADAPHAATPKPPWCGACEERTRQTSNEDGLPMRCPACHPLADSAQME